MEKKSRLRLDLRTVPSVVKEIRFANVDDGRLLNYDFNHPTTVLQYQYSREDSKEFDLNLHEWKNNTPIATRIKLSHVFVSLQRFSEEAIGNIELPPSH